MGASRVQGGASHYIVGRDPAGMKHPTKNALQPSLGDDLYHMWHGQTMLQLNPVLDKKLELLPFHFASYDLFSACQCSVLPAWATAEWAQLKRQGCRVHHR